MTKEELLRLVKLYDAIKQYEYIQQYPIRGVYHGNAERCERFFALPDKVCNDIRDIIQRYSDECRNALEVAEIQIDDKELFI